MEFRYKWMSPSQARSVLCVSYAAVHTVTYGDVNGASPGLPGEVKGLGKNGSKAHNAIVV
jgi:hypothetical protein